jgi:hypothetical protein
MQISANTSVKTIEGEPQPSQIASFTTTVLCGGQLTLPLLLLVHRSLHVRNSPFRFGLFLFDMIAHATHTPSSFHVRALLCTA